MRFRIADVFLPTTEGIAFADLGEGDLDGTIVDFSDSGERTRVFALVDVVRRQTLVVPVEKLELISQSGRGTEGQS